MSLEPRQQAARWARRVGILALVLILVLADGLTDGWSSINWRVLAVIAVVAAASWVQGARTR